VPREQRDKPAHGQGRDALLEATMRVVGRLGLDGLTNRIVAEEAGVTHGLVRHYFGTRDEMVREAFHLAVRRATERNVIESDSGSLDDFAAGLGGVVAAEPEEEAFQYEVLLAALRRPELLADVRETYADFFRVTAQELGLAGFDEPDDALARLVFAALDGLVIQQLLYGNARQTETAIIRLRELLKAALQLQQAGRQATTAAD
jgi:TetR/AcrR family transcriptional regulator, regulator of biofilm formation and stress response